MDGRTILIGLGELVYRCLRVAGSLMVGSKRRLVLFSARGRGIHLGEIFLLVTSGMSVGIQRVRTTV